MMPCIHFRVSRPRLSLTRKLWIALVTQFLYIYRSSKLNFIRLFAAFVLVYIIREDNTVVDSCCLKKKNEINGALTISRSRIVFRCLPWS